MIHPKVYFKPLSKIKLITSSILVFRTLEQLGSFYPTGKILQSLKGKKSVGNFRYWEGAMLMCRNCSKSNQIVSENISSSLEILYVSHTNWMILANKDQPPTEVVMCFQNPVLLYRNWLSTQKIRTENEFCYFFHRLN